MRSKIDEFRPVFDGLRTPFRAFVAALTVVTAAVTAIAYLLPLAQDANDTASNLSFFIMMLAAIAAVVSASAHTTGLQQRAWLVILASFTATAVLFGLDPQTPDGELTVALDAAVLPSLAFAFAVVVLCVPVLPSVANVRTVADIAWLATAMLIAGWAGVIEPVVDIIGRSDLERFAHLSFIGTSFFLTLAVLVFIPSVRGEGRIVLWFLGLGGGMVSIAGVLHIQFFYDGSLRFGSAFDYLWTAGIGCLAIAALLAGDHRLEFRPRGVYWNSALTVLPLIPAVYALIQLDHEEELPFAIALIVALCLRVLALLFENDRLTRNLRDDATRDPLTGLANRRTLLQGIGGVGRAASRHGHLRAVLSVDLDRFKAINDQYGHLIGDRVLALVAERLRHGVRGDAALIRFGGDEFLIAINTESPEQARRAAERIRQAIAGDYVIDELVVAIDATIGVAIDDGHQAVNTMLETADRALYVAKDAGRGRVELADATVPVTPS